MADARLLHKKGSHGERVIALDHLEFRVWAQYVLSADDYGVMRASASVLRADNPKLEREPFKRIVAAMRAIVDIGLVQVFEHQGVTFWWQTDWQDFQNVRYPRETVNPQPSPERIATATPKTRTLFGLRTKTPREDFGSIAETPPTPAGAGGRETQTLTPTLQGSGSSERDRGLINGSDIRRHGNQHAWCDWDSGMCVPYSLHDDLSRRLKAPDADVQLRGWYPTVLARYAGRAIGDDVFVFWRNEFAAWVGTVSAKPLVAQETKAAAAVDAFDRADTALRDSHARRTEATPGRPEVVGRGASSQGR